MTYEELQTAVLEDAHRPDLAPLVPRFIAEAEEMIRNDLTGYMVSSSLGESDRLFAGFYTLPSGVLTLRAVVPLEEPSAALVQVGLDARPVTTGPPRYYTNPGDGTIEIQGTPADGADFRLVYFGHPPSLEIGTDTNELLRQQSLLYKSAALFRLHAHAQDAERADNQLRFFNSAIEALNERVGRSIGGAQNTPAYNFSSRGHY